MSQLSDSTELRRGAGGRKVQAQVAVPADGAAGVATVTVTGVVGGWQLVAALAFASIASVATFGTAFIVLMAGPLTLPSLTHQSPHLFSCSLSSTL